MAAGLPADLAGSFERVQMQILLPTEESTLCPVDRDADEDGEDSPAAQRIAPALWTLPGLALPLRRAVPWLIDQDPRGASPGLRLLILLSRLVRSMADRGEFTREQLATLGGQPLR